MNAPAASGALAPEIFEIVPLAAFAPSQTATQKRRRARFTKDEQQALADSIKAIGGLIEPIVVRPHPKPVAPVRYEIVAGERWPSMPTCALVARPNSIA